MLWFNRKAKVVTGSISAAVILATGTIAGFEGLRTKAYLDPVGIPTICYGETEGVKLGQTQTAENCSIMLGARVKMFAIAVDAIIVPPMADETLAAFTSFAYNIGIGAFQKSTLARLYNEGKFVEACNQLPRWNKAGGKSLPGLVKRREAEKQMCLKGVTK